MTFRAPGATAVFAALVMPTAALAQDARVPTIPHAIHDMNRERPPVVNPGTALPSAPAPSDAIVLFDGRDLSEWKSRNGQPARWKVENGYMEVISGSGGISTARQFGDCQLHIEWASPAPPSDKGQDRGNSGVFLMGMYEVQVLDSHGNDTYPDGQAAAIYGQYPPLVNVSRPPGEWQSYDIIFRRPRFSASGALLEPARITVLHNGVVVHNSVALTGPSGHRARPAYRQHPDRLSISLQDHASPVRFRNIWIRDLER